MITFDLADTTRRALNQALHDATGGESFEVANPRGAHAVACGITADIDVVVRGSVGYYCAGMHQQGRVLVEGNASTGLAENIMSGVVRITGNATMSAGATGCGGLVVVGGNAGRPLRDLHEGRRHSGRRTCRPHERVHGPGREPGGMR